MSARLPGRATAREPHGDGARGRSPREKRRADQRVAPEGRLVIEGLILPDVANPEVAPFWEGCALGELRVQACASCGRRRMPPRPMCPWCRSFDVRWDAMSGRARVWSVVIPHPPLLPAYGDQAP